MRRKTAGGEPRGARILVCDDEPHIVRLIQVNLERQGFDVTLAYSVAQALPLLSSTAFGLLVIDAELGGLQSLLTRMQHLDTCSDTRIIVMGKGNDQNPPPPGHFPDPPPIYITKPFNPMDLARLGGL